jgi:hypothetical protein
MPSHLDTMFHKFQCPSSMCKRPFQKVLRTLVHAAKVACPYCGTQIDICQSKSIGAIGKVLDTARELDKPGGGGASGHGRHL